MAVGRPCASAKIARLPAGGRAQPFPRHPLEKQKEKWQGTQKDEAALPPSTVPLTFAGTQATASDVAPGEPGHSS